MCISSAFEEICWSAILNIALYEEVLTIIAKIPLIHIIGLSASLIWDLNTANAAFNTMKDIKGNFSLGI
jgi:hypothetical protein